MLVITFFIASCVALSVDYDRAVNFSQYKSYDFYPDIESGLNSLDNERIMTLVDSMLNTKGIVQSGSPQLLINFFSNAYVDDSGSSIGIGLGKNLGIEIFGEIPIGSDKINQSLTVDFIDAEKDALVWQAVISSEYSISATPQEKEAYYRKLIQKAFKKFPPGKK